MGNETHPAVRAAADAMGLQPVLRIEAASIEVATRAIQAFLEYIGLTTEGLGRLTSFYNDSADVHKRNGWIEAIRAVQEAR